MTMTPEAKRALSQTIRELRARLLEDLQRAAESTYRLGARHEVAGLSEEASAKRRRLEEWVDEQARTQTKKRARSRDDFFREAEKQAAYTLLNRLILLKLLEASADNKKPIRKLAVVTGGWESKGYKDFFSLAPDLCTDPADASAGFAFLLQLVFEDLALDLPGLFGPAGIADLIPIPGATLRAVVNALNKPDLQTCWADDMTLGWIYQYWNDPEREALDAKINDGGKIEPHEIASKTQMFTERYMVDWLLQNTIGPLWLALCRKHGWTPRVEHRPDPSTQTLLERLDTRRSEWRAQRDQGTVLPTDLMPLHDDAERRWAYFVPQPIPQEAIDSAPDSLQNLKLLDPAVGSGHFLVAAFDLLFPLYQEEAQHRGEAHLPAWSDDAIANAILSKNLHGVDIDPRAVQIAAAALWLKARQRCAALRPDRLNLVASHLRLAALPADDPSLTTLRQQIDADSGIPPKLTDTILQALRGADHLGSLLKIDKAVDAAIRQHETTHSALLAPIQKDLFSPTPARQAAFNFDAAEAKRSILQNLEAFLTKHTHGDDLGLRLQGQQLASGVRFVRILQESQYHIVVGNPPYQGTSKMADAQYVAQHYPLGKADLYAAFLLRSLELTTKGGTSALLTMRNWMFIKQYSGLRESLLDNNNLTILGDFDRGAFEGIPDEVVSVSASIFSKINNPNQSVALLPTPLDDHSRDSARTDRKRAAVLCQVGRFDFTPAALRVVPEWPLVYWWDDKMLQAYQSAPLIGKVSPAKFGATTGNNARFVREVFEIIKPQNNPYFVPFINGAKGRAWIEELSLSMEWKKNGLQFRVFAENSTGANFRSPEMHFRKGIAFSMIGANFSARAHRYPSIFGDMGSSIFPKNIPQALCSMNAKRSRTILESLNPSVHFQVGDVNRLPLFPIADAEEIFAQLEEVFGEHEGHREPSVEFREPGPSRWREAQAWAQEAVDRGEGEPLPAFAPMSDAEPVTDHVSYALGVALGRFGARGEGILDPQDDGQMASALPHGVLFLDGTLDAQDRRDSLGHPAASALWAAWASYGGEIAPKEGLRGWLASRFFGDVHKKMYENKPIHWPLSSAERTFVVWVNIHRLTAQTLRVVLADHLLPTQARLEGELKDLGAAKALGEKTSARAAEKLYALRMKAAAELRAFVEAVEQCAFKGPLPTDGKCLAREQDAPYAPDLDDGVMINSAALWALLEPQWKEPKKWWKELASAAGKKDYDWSHLALRYFPMRVDKKCQEDPSLAVAHGCFWRYHPARAWAWELRLQDEIAPTFTLTEAPYRPGGRDLNDPGDGEHRRQWLDAHQGEALAAIERESLRRMGRAKRRRLVSVVTLQAQGLWSRDPRALWDMELRLSEKQGAELRILAPDEPTARAQLLHDHPELGPSRAQLLASLTPSADLFTSDEPDPEEEDTASPDDADD